LGKIGTIWANLVGFGRHLSKIKAKFGQTEAKLEQKVIRFGQNQNLTSSKTFDLLRLWFSPLNINLVKLVAKRIGTK